jgi:DNA-binding transcriptional regulator YhcF (GntR family)
MKGQATAEPELPGRDFRLDAASGVPFYRQIIDQVLFGIASGRLKPGEQLPTARQLAVDLAINLNTVAKAYKEMEIRGIVETQQGSGTFIADRPVSKPALERRKAVDRLVDDLVRRAAELGLSVDEIVVVLRERTKGR